MEQIQPFSVSNDVLAHLAGADSAELRGIEQVNGGYSRNRRAIATVGDQRIFLKEVDVSLLEDDGELELGWLKKDHLVIETLRTHIPSIVPEWSRLTMNGHLLILPSYDAADGWHWTPPTDSALQQRYIRSVIDATHHIEQTSLPQEAIRNLSLEPYFRQQLVDDDSFDRLSDDDTLRAQLIDQYERLRAADCPPHLIAAYDELLEPLRTPSQLASIGLAAKELADQADDSLNHCDVRSDNIAFHEPTAAVKFVDWNWTSYAPKKFGSTEFLVDLARRGVDVSPFAQELNPQLLAGMVGLYLIKSLKPPLSPTSQLRQMQAETGAISYMLYKLVS